MGREKGAKKFNDVYGTTPSDYYWTRIIQYQSVIEASERGDLGKYLYNNFYQLKPLEQIYVRELKPAFDIWLKAFIDEPEKIQTALKKKIFEVPIEIFMMVDRSEVYDTLFHYLFKEEVTIDFVMGELDCLLDNDAVPYTNYFDVSCYFFIYATRCFIEEDVGNAEENHLRAMYEAINFLNKFMLKHEIYQQEKMNEVKKDASRKGGENRLSKLRLPVVKILKDEVLKGTTTFKNVRELTQYIVGEVERTHRDKDIVLPDDLFDTIYGWSESAKSDISILYWMLLNKKSTK